MTYPGLGRESFRPYASLLWGSIRLHNKQKICFSNYRQLLSESEIAKRYWRRSCDEKQSEVGQKIIKACIKIQLSIEYNRAD